MAIVRVGYQVACDAPTCQRTGPTASTPGDARTRAKWAGFRMKPYPSDKAFCLSHAPDDKDWETKD